MIKSFNNFITEKLGYPEPIRGIVNIVERECTKRLDKYFSTRGKFTNYVEKIEIPYDEIERSINVLSDDFKKYPVEFITINFKIIVRKTGYEMPTFSGHATFPLKSDTTSTWIFSETPGIKKAYILKILLAYDHFVLKWMMISIILMILICYFGSYMLRLPKN